MATFTLDFAMGEVPENEARGFSRRVVAGAHFGTEFDNCGECRSIVTFPRRSQNEMLRIPG